MQRKFIEILVNLIFWILTIWIITQGFSISQVEHTVENGIESVQITRNSGIINALLKWIALSAVLFYANLYLLSRGVKIRRIFFHSALILLLGLIAAFTITEFHIFGSQLRLPTGIITGTLVFYFSVSLAYGLGKRWVKGEIQRKNLLIEKKQAELNWLRGQLHPHFLFNVLNNLLAMVDQEKNPLLASAIDKLSELLRYVVYETIKDRVPVRREISFIENYAELQKLRFTEEEIDFELHVLGSYDNQTIEPGIFIPFVENAFKHGTAPETISKVSVQFDLSSENRICFSVQNEIMDSGNEELGGNGLDFSRKRLNLAYPYRHDLQMIKDENTYRVNLEIKTHD